MSRPTYAEVDLTRLKHNIALLKDKACAAAGFLAVVKADAYGHGAVPVSKAALQAGASMLGVAIPEEGSLLRKAGIDAPILILGPIGPESYEEVILSGLTPTIFSTSQARELETVCRRLNKFLPIHLKIDSGMRRIGFTDTTAFRECLSFLKGCTFLSLEGMFTHFSVSETPEDSFTDRQAECFMEYVSIAHEMGFSPLIHAANTGAILNHPAYNFDMVRGGIAMYGYHPAALSIEKTGLQPVMSWKTHILHIKTISPGDTVSYGRTFTADRAMRIATLPVGYGDGYQRSFSGKASVLIHGKRCPQIGTVCMDQIMVDITDVADAALGDEAVLLGTQGNETITADELAAIAGTISYEILLSISSRVPRIILQ